MFAQATKRPLIGTVSAGRRGRLNGARRSLLTAQSLSGLLGVETVGINSGVPLSVPNRFFDDVRATYSSTDNFEIFAGHEYTI
jgi:hypothetical protein